MLTYVTTQVVETSGIFDVCSVFRIWAFPDAFAQKTNYRTTLH